MYLYLYRSLALVLAIVLVRATPGDTPEFQNAALLVDREASSPLGTEVRTGVQTSSVSINPGGPVQSLTTATTTGTNTEVRTGVQTSSVSTQPGGPMMSTTMPVSSTTNTEVRSGAQASITSSGATTVAAKTTSNAGRINGVSLVFELSLLVGALAVSII